MEILPKVLLLGPVPVLPLTWQVLSEWELLEAFTQSTCEDFMPGPLPLTVSLLEVIF